MVKNDVVDILSSEARIRTLKVLSDSDAYLTLRQIEFLSGLAIGSVQLAMKSLVQKKVVSIEKKKGTTFFKLNLNQPHLPTLKKIFDILEFDDIQERSQRLNKNARNILQFCSEQMDLLRKAR